MTEHEVPSSWKRMSFKGNKVWAAAGSDGELLVQNGKVLIKYNLKQAYEYRVKRQSLKPESDAVPGEKSNPAKKKAPRSFISKSTSKSENHPGEPEPFERNAIVIYTDGASSGNPGPAGIGVYFQFNGHAKEISESIGIATNNIAELSAIKRALLEIKRFDLPVRLHTDSSYALGLLTKGWKPKKNQNLVESIKKLIIKFKDLKFIKVKGHSGIHGNETADLLATEGIKKHQANGDDQ